MASADKTRTTASTAEQQAQSINLKVCILNGSGNVGKTTIASQLLYPRLERINCVAPTLIELETHNYSASGLPGITTVQKTGKQFKDVYEAGLSEGAVIVDVGASNIAHFFEQMQSYKGSDHIFNLFVLPVTPGDKEIRDTLSTLALLHDFGVAKERIRVVFNRAKTDGWQEDYKLLMDASKTDKYGYICDLSLVIHDIDLFKDIGEMRETVESLFADDTDYDKLVRETPAGVERRKYVTLSLSKRQAASVRENLDRVFMALIKNL